MKSRSHRLPTSDPPEDWVNGSWTVDCVCGVNFDDGEEMVNCDECGVWVHTRCSRYVKGERLFACDKCKSKKSRSDSEETEVAQLLVELPTKTLRLDNPYTVNVPPRGAFMLFPKVPMEDKVHVQGIPGGDPALFAGLSSIFSPELWKCAGYVPKKFNFQYKEFPFWDEKREDCKGEEDIEKIAGKGAGVLYSLSKENKMPNQASTLDATKSQFEGVSFDTVKQMADLNKHEVEGSGVIQHCMKKGGSLLKPVVSHSSKRKKEDIGTLNDPSGKKKAKAFDRVDDSKRRGGNLSKSGESKRSELYEVRGSKHLKADTQTAEKVNSRGNLHANPLSDGCHTVYPEIGNTNEDIFCRLRPSETLPLDVFRNCSSIEARTKKENDERPASVMNEIAPQSDVYTEYSLHQTGTREISLKDEDVGDAVASTNDYIRVPSARERAKLHVGGLATASIDVMVEQDFPGLNVDVSCSSLLPKVEVEAKADEEVENLGEKTSNAKPSASAVVRLEYLKPPAKVSGLPSESSVEGVKQIDGATTVSQSQDHKVQNVKEGKVVIDCQLDRANESTSDLFLPKRHLAGSESYLEARKGSLDVKICPSIDEGPSESSGTVLSSSPPLSQRKMVVSVGKSSSSSSTILIRKPSHFDNSMMTNTESTKSIAKPKRAPDCNFGFQNTDSTDDVIDRGVHERPKKFAKVPQRLSANPVMKPQHSSKLSHAPISRKPLSDSRDQIVQYTSKTSHAAGAPDSAESAVFLQVESALHLQNKIVGSGLPLRGEKVHPSIGSSASRSNHLPSVNSAAPISQATLSDEELALLLHQELNSSPRVPRVPRIRHAGSLPQLATPTATAVLMKRASSSGGKDDGSVFRRKSKEVPSDRSQNSHQQADEDNNLPNQRRHESSGNGSMKGLLSVDKAVPSVSTTISSGPSSSAEAIEQNTSILRTSPQVPSDDDTGSVGRPTNRTLPGLIAEIMSKGKRMTYEELCNAVLPHWPNLRKHNGERYAYSSHSQAVLDCLRNRSEWARLVDRGPKQTNASKKRRKLDADAQSIESVENDNSKERITTRVDSKGSFESRRDEFPKGKRKARKRRRLALRGKGIKDVRKGHKVDGTTEEDAASSSTSSGESLFSDDDMQGGTKPVVREASASSDERGAVS